MFPDGFVYLESLDPTILQEIRYAGCHNFMGRPVPGYNANRCVVSKAIGRALVEAQKEANTHGLTLKVYDGYRPLRAVEAFVLWAQDLDDEVTKGEFYAHVPKSELFEREYIGVRSFHARGAAVDLTLVPLPVPNQPTFQVGDQLLDGILPKGERFADNSLDMGTGFDVFHELSHTDHPDISTEAKANRKLLCEILGRQGLVSYEWEWWHFNLADEPFPNTYFDFAIK